MYRPLFHHRFLAFAGSLGLHGLVLAALIVLAARAPRPAAVTPVDIVDLPNEVLQNLPPLKRPVLPPPPQGRSSYRSALPLPGPRGGAPAPPDIALPKTAPVHGIPDRSGTASDDRSPLESADAGKGPLPFLSQADIDELARKGMPAKRPGDDSVTLDTDEFKYITYNRWLKVRVESVLKYPELAALTGLQGTLFIQFDIMKDGTLGSLELLKSSGYKILDDEALRAIRASAPFQPLPEEWHEEHYSIRAAVLFYLSEAYIR
jgi:TonB family protein